MAAPYSETLAVTGSTQPWRAGAGRFSFSLGGTFTGLSGTVERREDGGTTWKPCTGGGTPVTFTVACSEVMDEPESAGADYRFTCTTLGTGSVVVRFGQ